MADILYLTSNYIFYFDNVLILDWACGFFESLSIIVSRRKILFTRILTIHCSQMNDGCHSSVRYSLQSCQSSGVIVYISA